MMRENQRALKRAIRDLDRERNNMQKQEKKIIIGSFRRLVDWDSLALWCGDWLREEVWGMAEKLDSVAG